MVVVVVVVVAVGVVVLVGFLFLVLRECVFFLLFPSKASFT